MTSPSDPPGSDPELTRLRAALIQALAEDDRAKAEKRAQSEGDAGQPPLPPGVNPVRRPPAPRREVRPPKVPRQAAGDSPGPTPLGPPAAPTASPLAKKPRQNDPLPDEDDEVPEAEGENPPPMGEADRPVAAAPPADPEIVQPGPAPITEREDAPPPPAPPLSDTGGTAARPDVGPGLGEAARLMGSALRRTGAAGVRSVGAGASAAVGNARALVRRTADGWAGAAAGGPSPEPEQVPTEPPSFVVRPDRARRRREAGSDEPADMQPVATAPVAPAPGRRGRRRAPGTRTIRWGWRLFLWSLFLLLFGAAATVFAVWAVMRDLPLADVLPPLAEPTISVETVDGQVLTTRGAYQAPYVGLAEFPPHLVDAVLAVEDKRFWDHGGVDPRGIGRALYRNVSAGGVVEGGSTITQQLVKILYLEPERTLSRKLQEAVLATTLERQLGKERILELYLNSVYLGSGAYGMPAAARTYYGKDVGDLTLPEATTLAASIQLPSQVNPLSDLAATQNRAALVLNLMADQGRIEEETRDAALAQLALLAPEPPPTRAGSYFADWVLNEVEALKGASSQSLSATATLDPELQAETERIVQQVMAEEGAAAGASQAAVVVMTPNGRVRAMVGGLDYGESQFNRATDALRQPGSTFKTFVYMAALVMGATPDTPVSDDPIEIGDWAPGNFDGESHGVVTLREAFAQSYNQATVRLAQEVGNANIIEVARRFGIQGELRDTPSLALGPSGVTLLDMIEAFAALALGRMPVNATGIETLRFGEDGQALGVTGVNDREQTRLTRTREPMLDLLRAVVTEGTGRAAAIEGLDIVGKTGTSQESRDAWFIGFAHGQGIVIGVWVGNDDNSPMDRVTGGGIPARIFREVMLAAVARQGAVGGATAGASVAATPATPEAQAEAVAQPLCDIRACSAAYRSFDAATCTYQPWEGPRRLCTR